MVALIIVFLAYLVWIYDFAVPPGEYYSAVQKIALSYLQMLGALGIFKARGTAVFNEVMSRPAEIVGGSFTSFLPVKCALNSQIYGPFLLNMAMPPVLLAVAALLMWPKVLFEKGRAALHRKRGGVPHHKARFSLPRQIAVCRVMRKPMESVDIGTFRNRNE